MKRYVVGFMFNDDKSKICLIKKNRPEWQKGLLNGIGGHIELGESSLDSMIREFYEETGVATHIMAWCHVCTLRFPYAEVEFFAGANTYYVEKVKTTTDETVHIVDVAGLSGVIENLPPLIELSLQRLSDRIGVAPVAWQQTQHQGS
jgi:8-oxo-dGTP diphosphatase